MVKVFISYRRQDSGKIVDLLHPRLAARLGDGRVFRDLSRIYPGRDFRDALEDALGQCDVLLAVIGPGWLGATDPSGRRRLDDENDWVRSEVRGGLWRNIHVVPVLVGGAEMPPESELPPDLEGLTFKQAQRLRPGPHFDGDVARLLSTLEGPVVEVFDPSPPPDGGEGLFPRLLAFVWPWLHFKLVERGLIARPPEFSVVHNYLNSFAGKMEELNQVARYVPLGGAERAGPPSEESEYARRQTRTEILTNIRRTVRLLSGLSAGGGQDTAQLASLNRSSRVVRNVAGLLRRKSEPVILLGDPGSGKSMTLREVGRRLARLGLRRARPPVVIYVRLGQYTEARGDKPGEVWALVKKNIPKEHVGLRDLLPLLERQRRLVILFDGMDEMERRLYGARITYLSEFARNYEGTIKTLFACRTNDFSPKFIHRQLVLLEFDERQVRRYLSLNLGPGAVRIDGELFKPARLARHLLNHSEMSETARNPLTLSLLCLFFRNRESWPQTRHMLFDNYVRTLFDRLHARADRPPADEGWPEISDGWARLGFRITSRHAGISIGLGELREEWFAGPARAVVDSGLRCGLLVLDESDEQSVRFTHHRLQEYLTACFLDRYWAEHEGIDWASLIDTPRWQEVLINLTSIQQERSRALKVVQESMQAVIDLPAVGDAEHIDGAAASPWKLPAAAESLLAGRVVLASRVVRELGQNPAKLPEGFLESFRGSIRRLAEEGRPTTQVRMLWAWSNAPDACPISALDAPLNSEVNWVREQALSVVGGGNTGRTRVDADLRRELVIDLTNGRLLRRLGAYRKAIVRAGEPALYVNLAWAVLCRVAYAAGLLGLFYAACLLAVTGWMPTLKFERMLPGLPAPATALAVLALGLSASAMAWRERRLDLWRRTVYTCSAACSLLYLLDRLGAGDNLVWGLLTAAVFCGVMVGCLWLGSHLLFWAAFGLYMAPSLLGAGASRWQTARRLAWKNSLTELDSLTLRGSGGAVGAVLLYRLLSFLSGLFSTYVAEPVNHYFGDHLGRLGSVVGYLILSLIGLGLLYALGSAVYNWLAETWGRLGPSASGSWGATTALISRHLGRNLRSFLAAAPRAVWKVLKWGLAILSIPFVLGLPFVLVFEGLERLGVDEERRSQLPRLLLMLGITGLLVLSSVRVLWGAWQVLRLYVSAPRRRRDLYGMAVGEWVRRVAEGEPETQALYLRETSPGTLRVEADEFLRALEGLEAHVTQEPAASQYWKTRHTLEEIVRQERLANTAGPVVEAAPERSAVPADGGEVGGRPAPAPDAPPAPERQRPGRLSNRRRLQWALSGLLLLAAGGFILNEYTRRHRTVYIVNGMLSPVEVVLDGGEAFTVGPQGVRTGVLAEGAHAVTFRRPQGEPRTQPFELVSPSFFDRLTANEIYVLNIGGAALVRSADSFVRYADGWRPVRPRYEYGRALVKYVNARSPFEAVPLPAGESPPLRNVNEVRLSPDLPAWFFWRLASEYPEGEVLALAEKHLGDDPGNTLLLHAYEQFAFRRGRAGSYRDFLQSQLGRRAVPAEWYHRWQEVSVRLEGPEAIPRLQERLRELLGRHGRDESELSCLRASLQVTTAEALRHYEEALRLGPRNAHARYGKCTALRNQGELRQAREFCLESLDVYRQGLKEGLGAAANADTLSWALSDRAGRDLFFYDAWHEVLDLDLALQDTAAAAKHLEAMRWESGYSYVGHHYGLALDVALGRPDAARERHRRCSEEEPACRANSAATLHYLLREFDEHARAAREATPEAAGTEGLALAQLELGNYSEAERLYRAPYEEARALFSLLLSFGQRLEARREADESWRKAERELSACGLPVAPAIHELLSSPSAPSADEVKDLNLGPTEKATLLLALAQRFPELRAEALEAAGRLAYTRFPPGHFLRRAAQTLGEETWKAGAAGTASR